MELVKNLEDDHALKNLHDSIAYAREGNVDEAYASAALYFDEAIVQQGIENGPSSSNDIGEGSNQKTRIVRYGLIFKARLARTFGHFNQAHFLLAEAIQQAQGANDFLSLRLALLEQANLEICTSRGAMLGRYVRDEGAPITDFRDKGILVVDGQIVGAMPSDELTPAEERAFADKNADVNEKLFTEQLIGCARYMKALDLAIRCRNSERAIYYLKSCLSIDLGVDRATHAKVIQDAARSAISTIQLSENMTCAGGFVLPDMFDNTPASEEESEANVVIAVNSTYALALDGKFEKAFNTLDLIKKKFPEKANPLVAYHWQVAEACIDFDYKTFFGEDTDLETLECYSPTEADFRRAILIASRGDFKRAVDILNNRLSILQKGIDAILNIRCVIILGMVHCEGNAMRTGIKTLQDVLLTAIMQNLGNFVCMIKRRLAHFYIKEGQNLDEAKTLLDSCAMELDKSDSPRLERGMYYVTRFEWAKKCAISQASDE
ncbi:suppressor of spindle checkpoint defect 1 [Ditylenchus destructor]|nr:suppressor of spindle checkpoint defect 1 [Ditylenchus destructor]